ncbi:MAG: MGMT family protein [Treponema sp.]|nr:MGMT family protein [Treponema sp.]
MSKLDQIIYAAVRCIPRGKVATYSQIAALTGNCNLRRYVGNSLHKNPSNSITPCHRVVNAKGFCSGSFAFGGSDEQQKKLQAEGIKFINGHVDMQKFCITQEDFEIMHEELLHIKMSEGLIPEQEALRQNQK